MICYCNRFHETYCNSISFRYCIVSIRYRFYHALHIDRQCQLVTGSQQFITATCIDGRRQHINCPHWQSINSTKTRAQGKITHTQFVGLWYAFISVVWFEFRCGMTLHIHSQTSTVQPLKFWNRLVISSNTFLAYNRSFMLILKLVHISKRGPGMIL